MCFALVLLSETSMYPFSVYGSKLNPIWLAPFFPLSKPSIFPCWNLLYPPLRSWEGRIAAKKFCICLFFIPFQHTNPFDIFNLPCLAGIPPASPGCLQCYLTSTFSPHHGFAGRFPPGSLAPPLGDTLQK